MRAFALLLLLSACGGTTEQQPDAGSCPSDLPAACPSAAPTWVDAQPIIHARCELCHTPGGANANLPFDTYDRVYAVRQRVLTQVYACRMPPSGYPPLEASERKTLLEWLVCGAPP